MNTGDLLLEVTCHHNRAELNDLLKANDRSDIAIWYDLLADIDAD